ncbi:hypothetical protein [Pelagicoccus sp. SDUM812005]|uniref:hypothetical protein n=1 Tax=Pelagicoccus sp. SDUM812005 TaxID=3041257 RepID=UPI00280D78DC|nr:hypothetical protein [Pelagicoccus sp. SDUM812005]MDQ8182222.1 hypothetical protein [Pelagicoccus sp. SDUM812005]
MSIKVIITLAAVILLAGCATRREFTGVALHHEAISHPDRTPFAAKVLVEDIVDLREEKAIDPIFSAKPPQEIQRILEQELSDSGLFSDQGELASTIRIQTELVKFDWEVPGHDRKTRTAFTVSLLTGGLGGIAYGSSSTPVYGYVDLRVRVVDQSGSVILEKAYAAKTEEKMALLKSDTPKTMSLMTGKALGEIVAEFIDDLDAALESSRISGEDVAWFAL